jgi:type II secretory pathway component PulC
MGRRLLLLVDGILLVVAVFLGVRLFETWSARPSATPPDVSSPAVSEAPRAAQSAPPRPPLTAYAVIAERNLFSATRTEAPPEPPRPAAAAGPPVPPAPRPRLHGVVLLPEGRGRAYLEDVQRRRVQAYSVGDQVGDARLENIKSDRVVLRRGGETFEVLLYDPTKPRQAPPPSVQSPEGGTPGRPVIRRPSPPTPSPGPGVRAPGRPRTPTPAPAPTPGSEEQETNEEE